ncbi:flagellar assembly peptidoglycan hydrolase FlgJ [Massilia sp. YIM B02763]|uniref:flagellar assembly peptidoglycan hydrolase FlgJ n=1 Tax=Massilia sp. YIM B02763 TaxID=3050130 RepID=UPI0025B6C795|nr:flagellar assembly peptidoglycan hydrolase FlgJ [Massilia sp. YIM B02763]MDN4052636.1 flagellar assembly peptidoglycan hydrolase FlgJ [Massilia sp. YIM B02763]
MLGSTPDLSGKFALDTNALGDLKRGAKSGSSDALKGAATQFESMFINMMMKSMRDATPKDGPMDSQETRTFTTMLDQQMSQKLAKRGIGLADVLVRQLGAQEQGKAAMAQMDKQALSIGADASSGATGTSQALQDASRMLRSSDTMSTDRPAASAASGITGSARGTNNENKPAHVRAFQEKLADAAEEAEQATGVPAKFMLGQAALETGWGKRMIRNADGSSSNNLFGIKAGGDWKGKVATAVTTEYVNGHPHRKVEKFRAYDSHADAFKDYARMIGNNPRYEKVLQHGGDASTFAHGLQRAGYATDPQYAAKLSRIIKHSLA